MKIGILFLALFLFCTPVEPQMYPDKKIFLCFDDGPNPCVLEKLLPLLKKHEVLANFFVIGANVNSNKKIIKEMSDAGHKIENHSWGHENLKKLLNDEGSESVRTSIKKANNAIKNITGRKPKFFRPPFWEISKEIEKIAEQEGLVVLKLSNPDINTLDYLDASGRQPAKILTERVKTVMAARERQGKFQHVLVFHELHLTVEALEILIPYFQKEECKFTTLPETGQIRAIYLGSPNLFNKKKIVELEQIMSETNINGIVIDFKDSNLPSQEYLASLAKRFKQRGVYTIARIVVFQDSYFAKKHPEIAIKNSAGGFWHSGRKEWKRYWLDPASELAQNYNIEIAKKAIDAGFDEIQFDYIRFPTDGDMKDARYPIFNPATDSKSAIMKNFFQKMKKELKSYSPKTLIGIDVFGEVFLYGKETGIGQTLLEVAEYFDVISPMAYPSHYKCGEFGIKDPTAYPYKTYYTTLKQGLKFLEGKKIIIRPWIQNFTIKSIYGCGPTISYGKKEIQAQIKAGNDLDIEGFMLWNANSNFSAEALR